MKVNQLKLKDLLSKRGTQFIIPLYQRNYDWERKHCEKLFDDIIIVSSSTKENDVHFIGSIVYMKDNFYSAKGIDELIIIDGQQRITTITLLYLALYKFAKKNGDENVAAMIRETYLINKFANEDGKLKLRAAENNDRALKILMKDEKLDVPDIPYSRVDDNLKYFIKEINKSNFDIILTGIDRLVYIEVSLERGKDDPQRIFETMNSTGLDLSQSDLIRNFILMGLEKNEQDKIYTNYWKPIEENAKDIESKVSKSKVSDFIRDYLTLKTKNITKKDKVYGEYKKKYNYQNDIEMQEKHLTELKEYSIYYGILLNPQREVDIDIRKELKYIKQIQVNVSYPFLIQIYKDYKDKVIDKTTFINVLKLVQSYVIRRLVCGLPTAALNKIFKGLYAEIDKENYLYSIQKYLCSFTVSGRFPNDNEVTLKFKQLNVYALKSHNRKYIFELLENYNNKEHPIDLNADDNKLTVEHIFPQEPSREWKDKLNGNEFVEMCDKNLHLHTIGNLTLTGYNQKYSNRTFIEKRDMKNGFKESGLKLNQPLAKLNSWDLKAIKKRKKWMTERFCDVWKHPNIDSNLYDKQTEEVLSIFGD
jgi:uncharacterized protein with ParB-like and HNH nuclease domain